MKELRIKKIAVYDPSAQDCHISAEALREIFDRAGVKTNIKEFTDNETFVFDFRDNHYDMAFVGIGSIVDLEAARGIRALDEACPLFLVSGVAEYALEGYRLNALDFIVKPVTALRMREAVSRADASFLKADNKRRSKSLGGFGV